MAEKGPPFGHVDIFQHGLGGGRNRQVRQSLPASMPPTPIPSAFGHLPLTRGVGPLEPPLRGTRTCKVVQNFRRAKSEWLVRIPTGPLGPGCSKIAAGAVSPLRLDLPSRWRLVLSCRARPPGRAAYICGPASVRPLRKEGAASVSTVGAGVLTCPPNFRQDSRKAVGRPLRSPGTRAGPYDVHRIGFCIFA